MTLRIRVFVATLAIAIVLTISPTAAAPGEMFPIDIVLIADGSQLCVNHVDEQGDAWFIAEVSSVHPDLPPLPFEEGFAFRVTGQFCFSCVQPFCGAFEGFIFSANIVPIVFGDVNADGTVGILDLLDLLAALGPCPKTGPCPADLDDDGVVGITDLLLVLAAWS